MIMMFMVLCSKFGKFEGPTKGLKGVKRSIRELRIGIIMVLVKPKKVETFHLTRLHFSPTNITQNLVDFPD